MTDIFLEIEEDLRRDRAAHIWKKWGPTLVSAAVLIVVVVAGWRGYAAYQQAQAAKAGDAYLAAAQLAQQNNFTGAQDALQKLAADNVAEYGLMARFKAANLKAQQGDADGAAQAYDLIAKDASVAPALQELARLRAGLALVNTASLVQISVLVESLTAEGNTYRHLAREIMGLTAYRVGDHKAAALWFERIYSDMATPNDVRSRAQLALSVLAADGIVPE